MEEPPSKSTDAPEQSCIARRTWEHNSEID
jgi:hypothetical protein